uniref:Plastocyanin-like domain-containing protein n=1 Tax=Laticauda laticaudata TaxID=8630 RepID=A0A8C5WYB9_LATLA
MSAVTVKISRWQLRWCSQNSTRPPSWLLGIHPAIWGYNLGLHPLQFGDNSSPPNILAQLNFSNSTFLVKMFFFATQVLSRFSEAGSVVVVAHPAPPIQPPPPPRLFPLAGPVIKAEVGDTIQVTFANKASWPFSIQPHGGLYRKPWEENETHINRCDPFNQKTGQANYVLWLRNRTSDPPCLTWMYSSAVDPTKDINSGLVGPLLICRPGTLNERNKQKGIDKEFYLLFGVFNENLSWYLNTNRKYLKYTLGKEELFDDHIFKESNRMHAINGFLFGNLPLLDTCKGDTISWHLLGFGSETDVHGVAFQGNTILMNGMRRDTTSLFPHTCATALMQPDNQGKGLTLCPLFPLPGLRNLVLHSIWNHSSPYCRQDGTVRTFYIMAEEMEWDYAPDRSWESGRHNSSGEERYRGAASKIFCWREMGCSQSCFSYPSCKNMGFFWRGGGILLKDV